MNSAARLPLLALAVALLTMLYSFVNEGHQRIWRSRYITDHTRGLYYVNGPDMDVTDKCLASAKCRSDWINAVAVAHQLPCPETKTFKTVRCEREDPLRSQATTPRSGRRETGR